MKKCLYFPRTILRPILVSIPPAIVLASAIILNDSVKTPEKLFPLMIFSGLAIAFSFVFFFRVVKLTKEEIKMIGPFSSKDSSVINEGKTLIIGLHAAAIRAFWGRICGIAPQDLASAYPFPTNASFSEVDFEDGRFFPIAYSSDEHLAQLVTAFNA